MTRLSSGIPSRSSDRDDCVCFRSDRPGRATIESAGCAAEWRQAADSSASSRHQQVIGPGDQAIVLAPWLPGSPHGHGPPPGRGLLCPPTRPGHAQPQPPAPAPGAARWRCAAPDPPDPPHPGWPAGESSSTRPPSQVLWCCEDGYRVGPGLTSTRWQVSGIRLRVASSRSTGSAGPGLDKGLPCSTTKRAPGPKAACGPPPGAGGPDRRKANMERARPYRVAPLQVV